MSCTISIQSQQLCTILVTQFLETTELNEAREKKRGEIVGERLNENTFRHNYNSFRKTIINNYNL